MKYDQNIISNFVNNSFHSYIINEVRKNIEILDENIDNILENMKRNKQFIEFNSFNIVDQLVTATKKRTTYLNLLEDLEKCYTPIKSLDDFEKFIDNINNTEFIKEIIE